MRDVFAEELAKVCRTTTTTQLGPMEEAADELCPQPVHVLLHTRAQPAIPGSTLADSGRLTKSPTSTGGSKIFVPLLL